MERQSNERGQSVPVRCHRMCVSNQDFACFDFLRKRFYNRKDGKKSKLVLFMCGAISGAAAMSSTLALDFMRIRMAMEKDRFSYK